MIALDAGSVEVLELLEVRAQVRVEVVVHELFVCLIVYRYWLICIFAHVDDR